MASGVKDEDRIVYGKLFESMYYGTLSTNWKGLITFQQMIVLCDADGTIDMTPLAISRRTGIPIEIIEEGIDFLEQPDPDSRSPDLDGKRIVRLDNHRSWGWFIVNHKKYKELRDADMVRAQTRERVRRHREKKKNETTVTTGNGQKRHTDTDTNTDKKKKHDFSASHREIAEQIFKGVKSINPKMKAPKLKAWANTVRLMVEQDERTEEEIVQLFTWANQHDFWHQNILSPDKLRKKWDTLVVQKKAAGRGGGRKLRLPSDNEMLAGFAKNHELPGTRPGESHNQYRNRLNAEIEKSNKWQ